MSQTFPGGGDAAVAALKAHASMLRGPMIDFARRLIRTPSPPGQEASVAALVQAEMHALGYSDVQADAAGNVIGRVPATTGSSGRPQRSILFNTHMDHVDAGDPAMWPYPPYDAALEGDFIWGRAASDLKGSLAAQVYGGALLLRSGLPRSNELYVAGVVQEEVGGLGSRFVATHLKTDYAVIGEPSGNQLAIGHRGRAEMHVTITGRSVHASVPASGVNPLYSMSRFLLGVQGLHFDPDPDYPDLGPTTVAPTLLSTDQSSPNVVPGEATIVLDFRNTPADDPEELMSVIQKLLGGVLEQGAHGHAQFRPRELVSYTGMREMMPSTVPGFGIAVGDPLVAQAASALRAALGRDTPLKVWRFATDAGHLIDVGTKVIGFGPGDETVIHTVDERISVSEMAEAMVGNAAIALALE